MTGQARDEEEDERYPLIQGVENATTSRGTKLFHHGKLCTLTNRIIAKQRCVRRRLYPIILSPLT